jgi:hypothetical protein
MGLFGKDKRTESAPQREERDTESGRPDLDARMAAASGRRDELASELRRLQYAPPPRAELQTAIAAFVDRCGSTWLAAHGPRIVAALTPFPDAAAIALGSDTALTFGWLCATEPEQARVALASLLPRIDYEAGPPVADRETVLENVRGALAETRQEILRLTAERSNEWCKGHGLLQGGGTVIVSGSSVGHGGNQMTMPARSVQPSARFTVPVNQHGNPVNGSGAGLP